VGDGHLGAGPGAAGRAVDGPSQKTKRLSSIKIQKSIPCWG
jgi:hypothetical protein